MDGRSGLRPLRWLLLLAALAVLFGRLYLPSGPEVGVAPPPDLHLPLLDGGEMRLADLRGKTVVLDFWATWCPPCVESIPALDRVSQEFSERGLVAVAVNRDEGPDREARVRAFVKAKGLSGLRVALDDGRTAGALKVRALPTLVVLDREGTVRAAHVGAMEEDELRAFLSSAMAMSAAP